MVRRVERLGDVEWSHLHPFLIRLHFFQLSARTQATGEKRSVRPRASIQRGDCILATDAHPTQFREEGKGPRQSATSGKQKSNMGAAEEEERAERMLEPDRGHTFPHQPYSYLRLGCFQALRRHTWPRPII